MGKKKKTFINIDIKETIMPAKIVTKVEDVVEEVVVDEQPFEPVVIQLEIETLTQFKDLYQRLNIGADRIEEEYFEDLHYNRSDVNSSNNELWDILKQIRKAQGLKLKTKA